MNRIDVALLGGFELRADGGRVYLPSTAQRLVAYLCLQRRPVGRPHAAMVLWPDTTAARATANLRSALWRTQRSCPGLVEASAQHLALASGVELDLRRAEACADLLLAHPDGDLPPAAILSLELLPEWDDEWLLVDREHHHQLRLHALEALADRFTAIGRHGEAVAAGLAAVGAEPLRESAHRVVIRAHLAAGNRSEAVRQFDRCRRTLAEELALRPSAELIALVRPPRPVVAVPG